MIQNLFKTMINAGVDSAATPSDKMRLVVVNTMTTAGATLSLLLFLIYITLDHYDSVWAALSGFFICTISQYLLRRGFFSSIVVVVAGCNALIFVQHQLIQGLVPNYLFFFATATAPFVVFPPSQLRLAVLTSIIAFVLFLISIAYPNVMFTGRPVPPAALVESIARVIWVAAFAFALVPPLLLFTLVRRYQDEFHATQQSRIHTAKLIALGETAAGIAHEINNPLGVVCGKAEALLEELEQTGSLDLVAAKERLEAIERNGRRITRIISNLRALVRQRGQDPVIPFSVAVVVEETMQLVKEQFAALGLTFSIEVHPSLFATGRPSEVMQVITNVLNNARDALASRTTGREIKILARRQENRILLAISNNGPEIPSATLERIFEPFFSTKPPNHGTGLGLSISTAIMASQGGKLTCDSTPAWTTFTLDLPASKGVS